MVSLLLAKQDLWNTEEQLQYEGHILCGITATGASIENFLLPQQIVKLSHWGNDFMLK